MICALTGPSTVEHLEENIGGSGWQLASEDLEGLEEFLTEEDARLKKEQRASVFQILREPLSHPPQAFTNLIYAIETALTLGMTTEKEVLPLFQELHGLREALDERTRPRLEDIQSRLRALILAE